MTPEQRERLNHIRIRLRATHQQMYERQSESIRDLKAASDANLRAHEAIRASIDAAKAASDANTQAHRSIRASIDAVSDQHDEMAAFFAEVNDLDDAVDEK